MLFTRSARSFGMLGWATEGNWRRGIMALVVAGGLGASTANGKQGSAPELKVIVKPARIERRTFDPEKPPAEMPRLQAPEAAVCQNQFRCDVECQTESVRKLFKLKPATITSVAITVGLDVTIWLPIGAPAKLSDHEEAHREICERVYQHADASARQLGGRLLGYELQNSVKDETAVRVEIDQLQAAMMAAYMNEIGGSCARIQKYFDSITKHGTNKLKESEAIAQALAQEPLMAETLAASK